MRAQVETLAEAYLWLDEVRLAHAAFLVARTERTQKLEARARYVLGSLDAAKRFLDPPQAASTAGGAEPGDALAERAPEDPLITMAEKTRTELDAARAELDAWAEAEAKRFEEAFAAAETAIVERTEAYLAHHRPRIRVEVAQIAGGRCIVHLDRPGDDEAVLLCHRLAGRPPTRHDFLRDDAVEAADGTVHLAAREHGVDPEAVSAGGAEAEDALARPADGRLIPVRAHLPVVPPGLDWPRLRLRCRGPVLELEARERGAPYGHLVSAEEAELLTGYLVSLRARGLLDVDVEVA
jgi:hypothetical protein